MKKIVLSLILLFPVLVKAQTQFWSDDFEDVGSPASGVRTPTFSTLCGGPPATAYFARVATSDISTGTLYTGYSGLKSWACEDIDKGPTCVNNSVTAHQSINWTSINISGRTGLSFRGLFVTMCSASATDSIFVDVCTGAQSRVSSLYLPEPKQRNVRCSCRNQFRFENL